MRTVKLLWLLFLIPLVVFAQERSLFQADFPPSEFKERRDRVFEKIGNSAIALVQGAPSVDGFKVFRQTNEFYYLCGVETPHAYLLLDGRNRKTTLYLPHRDEPRERNEGKLLSAEDEDLVKTLTGVDQVFGVELLARHLRGFIIRPPGPVLFTPFSPSEGVAQSRDEHLSGLAGIASDPWDGRPSREGHFIELMRQRFPSFEIRDLSPILDQLRMIKSPREIALIRRASELAGLGLMEAMRSTRPGVYEYQLDAAARYVFLVNGARHEGYSSITAGGKNAWMGHYFHNASQLKAGDMVLMDYAPDFRYYTSDVTRMWPVNGKHTADQRTMGEIILAYRNALLKRIKPGVTAQQVLDGARAEMEIVIKNTKFSKDHYRKAAEGMLTFRGHLSHPVGMTVHDVGTYWNGTFLKGHVFSVDPMLWVPEEQLYIRMEDVVAVTETGVELFTDFLPSTPDEIEEAMKGDGIVQLRPPQQIKR
jgi:Xaa-Pro aminopeptidase